MWIKNFFNELKAWREVRKVCKSNTAFLEKSGIKYDWFGRMYKVINRDTEIELGTDEDGVYLQNDLVKLQQVLVQLNISDILAYEITPLESVSRRDDGSEEYEHGYLITLTPAWNLDKQYVTTTSVSLLTLGLLGLIGAIIFVIVAYV